MILNFKEEICDYISNSDDEQYCKLTDEEIDEVAENVWRDVACDDQLNNELNSTISWYVNLYLASKEKGVEE